MNLPKLALLLCACASLLGACEPPANATPLARLQAMWRDDLSKRASFKAHHDFLAQHLFDREQITVGKITGEAAFQRVDGTLAPSERSLILTGDLAALRKQPILTEVHSFGGFGNSFSAYLAPDGALILFWIIPEG
ncbi:MAG TPA: hypothetical protein VGO11_07595 [Chthoniobacteraceae bacterium]|jgi:hypothetical protein|nr:hypothetical protein [Chthoniobacteraceae bacterium]